jgi:hypothetical protein
MSRRRRDTETELSLDSFLDIVTNVVGVLILIAVVTVISAGDIALSSGASALTAPKASATRVMFECAGDKLFLVDEAANGERIRDAVHEELGNESVTADRVVAVLAERDIGDVNHRVLAEWDGHNNLTWLYVLRDDARAESDVESGDSSFVKTLDALAGHGFVYFVVHDDCFETYREARDLARARGVATGWHPVEGREPLRLNAQGSLGRRIQ